ncbi:MAG TPA: molybdopterin-dependent oxidoreductase [Steroidobacteraceae bacterium]|nr:molybdopterin-dependent oxidoreductase [Steroidobacteraceae bacterium]
MTATTPHTAHRICPLCEACCGLELSLDGDQILAVRGHAADVFSHGYICPKGVAVRDLHHDPDRLKTPLVKRGERFEPVSWTDAYAEVERLLTPLLARHGRQSVGVYLGNPVAHKYGLSLYVPPLVRALGTSNVFSASTLDQMPKQLAAAMMFGGGLTIPVPDIDRTDYLLVLGANPAASNGSLWTVPDFRGRARALRRRGGRLVVIDPRRSETAELADEHHFLRPGSDVFLLLGIAVTLIEENRLRLDRLARHVAGLEEAIAAVRPFTPERVAAATALPAGTIRHIGRELSGAPRAAVYGRIGTCTQEFGTLASWLVELLNVLTGNLDRPGGAMFPKAAAFATNTLPTAGTRRPFATGRRRSRVSQAPEVFGEFPATCMAEEIETPGEGQIRGMIVIGGNPVLSVPNGGRVARAFETLEVLVSMDIYLNETSRHARVILPGVSPLEESHFDVPFPQLAYRNCARYSPAVWPHSAARPAEWQTMLQLIAIAKGTPVTGDLALVDDEIYAEQVRKSLPQEQATALLARPTPWQGPERLLDLALRLGPYGDRFGQVPNGLSLAALVAHPEGIDLGALEPRLPEVLRTPSGKVELAPAPLIADLARAAARLDESPPDIVVIGRRQLASNNSWMHNLPTLAKGPVRCTVLIHPLDAARFGLTTGGRARLTAGDRSVEAPVEVSDEVMPGVVSLPHGWGHNLPGVSLRVAEKRPGANLNALLDDQRRDPLSGNAVLSGVAVVLQACA